MSGDLEWGEWRWRGTQPDGSPLDMARVIVGRIGDGSVRWARLYVEPVEQGGPGIDAAVRRMSGARGEFAPRLRYPSRPT